MNFSSVSTRVVQQLRALYGRERALVAIGIVGIGLGVSCLLYMAVAGRYIPPEGDLLKPATFDIAVGIYVLTLALYVPFARFSEMGHRRWVTATVAIVLYGFSIETVQQLRGVDPRFSAVATVPEQLAGLAFFVTATMLIPLYLVLAFKLRRRETGAAGRLLLISVGYATISALIGFGAGMWMSVQRGSHFAGADILPIHALGFHGLQAVPIVAVLLAWAGDTSESGRRLVHVAGAAWLVACAGVLWQTLNGVPLTQLAIPILLAGVALLAWVFVALRAVGRWRAAGWNVPAPPDMGSARPATQPIAATADAV